MQLPRHVGPDHHLHSIVDFLVHTSYSMAHPHHPHRLITGQVVLETCSKQHNDALEEGHVHSCNNVLTCQEGNHTVQMLLGRYQPEVQHQHRLSHGLDQAGQNYFPETETRISMPWRQQWWPSLGLTLKPQSEPGVYLMDSQPICSEWLHPLVNQTPAT